MLIFLIEAPALTILPLELKTYHTIRFRRSLQAVYRGRFRAFLGRVLKKAAWAGMRRFGNLKKNQSAGHFV